MHRVAGMIESAKVRLDVVYLGPLGCSPVEKTGPCSDPLQNSPCVLGKGGQRPYGALYAAPGLHNSASAVFHSPNRHSRQKPHH